MEEILHQLIGVLPHYLSNFNHPRWCRIFSIHSIIEYQYNILQHSTFVWVLGPSLLAISTKSGYNIYKIQNFLELKGAHAGTPAILHGDDQQL